MSDVLSDETMVVYHHALALVDAIGDGADPDGIAEAVAALVDAAVRVEHHNGAVLALACLCGALGGRVTARGPR